MLKLNAEGVKSLTELEEEIKRYVTLFTGYPNITVQLDGYDHLRITANSIIILDFYFNKLCEVTGRVYELGIGMQEIFAMMSTIRTIENSQKYGYQSQQVTAG